MENVTEKPRTVNTPREVTKNVRNKSGHRVELVINDKVVIFFPGQTVRVPSDAIIPEGLGLYVR